MATLYPSLISADLLNLEKVVKQLEPYCDGFHLDVMDNHFVPNLTMGPSFVNAVAQASAKPVWVHLMVQNPESMIQTLILKPGSMVSFHIESIGENLNIISQLTEKKLMPSIAINPKTNPEEVFPVLDKIPHVLVMSVEPGFSGQPFIENMMDKIDPLVAFRRSNGLKFRIGMDGGINKNNIKMLAQKGVDDFAVASAVFGAPNPVEALQELARLIK